MTTVTVCDATHDNIGHLPPGPAAGYTTGSGGVPWTPADWKTHPGAVRICQDPPGSDHTADILDVELHAATTAVAAAWAKAATAAWHTRARPGQRRPAIYMSRSTVTQVVNALIRGGVQSGIGLWIADWHGDRNRAATEVEHASGPFPVIGVQYANAGAYDISVFSQAWLQEVSVADTTPAKPAVPPGQWADSGAWTWGPGVCVIGPGLDGKQHVWQLVDNNWVKLK